MHEPFLAWAREKLKDPDYREKIIDLADECECEPGDKAFDRIAYSVLEGDFREETAARIAALICV